MKKTDLAYMAGIFDGEGCICIGKHQKKKTWNPTYSLKVNLVMCNPYIPNLFCFTFGGIVYERKRHERHLSEWNWQLNSAKAIPFLTVLLPYLKLKRDEARLAIEFQKNKKNTHTSRGNPYKPEQVALFEAQKILLKSLHNKSGVERNESKENVNA